MNAPGSYALVSPVRDEASNLARLASSIAAQTILPLEWIVVDNGSTDETPALLASLQAEHSWIELISIAAEGKPRPGAPIVRAFHAGLAAMSSAPDVVVKLDADVSLEPDHFQQLLAAFAADESLGIASGTCLEQDGNGTWEPVPVTEGHVRGAVRAYRSACLADVTPLVEHVGWDGVDGLKAAAHGWSTKMFPEPTFFHHRRLGARDGSRTARWRAQGEGAYFMRYRFGYLVLRSLYHARRDPAALAMVSSFLAAAWRRSDRCDDEEVRVQLRARQSLRISNLRARVPRVTTGRHH